MASLILSVFFPLVKRHTFTQALPGLPSELLQFWHQYPWPFGSFLCSLRSLLSERWACVPQPCLKLPNSSASYASVLTIVSFSMERYLAICRPLHPLPSSDETRCTLWKWHLDSRVLYFKHWESKLQNFTRATLVCILCWTVATLASIPHLLFTK